MRAIIKASGSIGEDAGWRPPRDDQAEKYVGKRAKNIMRPYDDAATAGRYIEFRE